MLRAREEVEGWWYSCGCARASLKASEVVAEKFLRADRSRAKLPATSPGQPRSLPRFNIPTRLLSTVKMLALALTAELNGHESKIQVLRRPKMLTSSQSNRPPPERHRRLSVLLHLQGSVHIMSRDTPKPGHNEPICTPPCSPDLTLPDTLQETHDVSGSRGEANFVWRCKNCKVILALPASCSHRLTCCDRGSTPRRSRPHQPRIPRPSRRRHRTYSSSIVGVSSSPNSKLK